jgi:hypothetical protein
MECIAIDEYFYNILWDFIKMNVEDAELKDLKGSRNIIKNYKPKLTIYVCHKIMDTVDIPRYLKRIKARL